MHLILTGATGRVGAGVLDVMLKNTSVTKVSIISRRPVALAEGHEKANVILHQDFAKWDESEVSSLRDARGVVWALGISQNEVTKDKYIEITKDYPKSFIKAFAPTSPFNFVYVSGEGATHKPGSLTPLFGRVKGEIEVDLIELEKTVPNLHTYNVRPAAVDPTEHTEIHQYIPKVSTFTTLWQRPVLAAIRVGLQSQLAPTRDLGRVLTDLAAGDGKPLTGPGIESDGRVVRNTGMRRLAGLS